MTSPPLQFLFFDSLDFNTSEAFGWGCAFSACAVRVAGNTLFGWRLLVRADNAFSKGVDLRE